LDLTKGGAPLEKLLNDPGLYLIKVFKPDNLFKTLGKYNYEVFVFTKKYEDYSKGLSVNLDFENAGNNFSEDEFYSGNKSLKINDNNSYVMLY
jgi:hypothetical protein